MMRLFRDAQQAECAREQRSSHRAGAKIVPELRRLLLSGKWDFKNALEAMPSFAVPAGHQQSGPDTLIGGSNDARVADFISDLPEIFERGLCLAVVSMIEATVDSAARTRT